MLPVQAGAFDLRPAIVQRRTGDAIAVPIHAAVREINVEDGMPRVFAGSIDQDERAAVRAWTAAPAAAESAEFAGDGYMFGHLCQRAAHTWCAVSDDVSG